MTQIITLISIWCGEVGLAEGTPLTCKKTILACVTKDLKSGIPDKEWLERKLVECLKK